MQITLNHKEIEVAIIEYISHQGIDLTDKVTTVTMIAGRGSNGYTANVAIQPDSGDPIAHVEVTQDNADKDPKSSNTFEFDEDANENSETSEEDTSNENLFGA